MQENIKNGNTSHDVVDGKTPNNQTAPFSSLPPDVSGSVRTEREAEDGESLARERAESEERRRTAQRVFSKQGYVSSQYSNQLETTKTLIITTFCVL